MNPIARTVLAVLIGLTVTLTIALAFSPPGERWTLALIFAIGVVGILALLTGAGLIHFPTLPPKQPAKPQVIPIEDAKPAREDSNDFPRLVG